jgi:hypothetical protein
MTPKAMAIRYVVRNLIVRGKDPIVIKLKVKCTI